MQINQEGYNINLETSNFSTPQNYTTTRSDQLVEICRNIFIVVNIQRKSTKFTFENYILCAQ